jgi:hypothetical protein
MALETSGRPADEAAAEFYGEALSLLERAGIPFLIGGAFAFSRYSKINRMTKDLDVFMMEHDVLRALSLFARSGYETELPYPHWLGKVHARDHVMDVIFSSGNGVARVDDLWFAHAVVDSVLGRPMRLCPAEEMIWSKAFVQERERFDGADVMHLLRELGSSLDWPRLLHRFGAHWRVLFGHLVLFGFVYPDRREQIPAWVMTDLTNRLLGERSLPDERVCNGTLLSREQYLVDLELFGYRDARVGPHGPMRESYRDIWTAAIPTRDE